MPPRRCTPTSRRCKGRCPAVDDRCWRKTGGFHAGARIAVPFLLPRKPYILTMLRDDRTPRVSRRSDSAGRMIMVHRNTFKALALMAVVMLTVGDAQAQEKKFPNWKGEWTTVIPRMPGQNLRFDPTKPYGRGQEAP